MRCDQDGTGGENDHDGDENQQFELWHYFLLLG
jgi:hypothetical protein